MSSVALCAPHSPPLFASAVARQRSTRRLCRLFPHRAFIVIAPRSALAAAFWRRPFTWRRFARRLRRRSWRRRVTLQRFARRPCRLGCTAVCSALCARQPCALRSRHRFLRRPSVGSARSAALAASLAVGRSPGGALRAAFAVALGSSNRFEALVRRSCRRLRRRPFARQRSARHTRRHSLRRPSHGSALCAAFAVAFSIGHSFSALCAPPLPPWLDSCWQRSVRRPRRRSQLRRFTLQRSARHPRHGSRRAMSVAALCAPPSPRL